MYQLEFVGRSRRCSSGSYALAKEFAVAPQEILLRRGNTIKYT